ncbi:MAG: helix-turn-helix domain-containing protein [Flavobacteriia bacterium]|nr:helix-turn-helix domain-containing protein [Flavobacteriia bacterium]
MSDFQFHQTESFHSAQIKTDKPKLVKPKKLKTNTTYLSKVINSQKEKNFNSYLNGLRINYVINLLKKEPQYRHYTIQALAEICGYTNARQFSIAFYEETKLKPSYFLNQIRKEKESL